MQENQYKIVRTCQNCKAIESLSINKREAAFHLVQPNHILGNSCKSCGGKIFSLMNEMPSLDADLIKEWANDEALIFLEQDEDLILAHEDYIDFIIEVLAQPSIAERKKSILLSALCVLIYDEVDEDINGLQKANVQKIIAYLKTQKELLLEQGDWIQDYIQEVVFPLI